MKRREATTGRETDWDFLLVPVRRVSSNRQIVQKGRSLQVVTKPPMIGPPVSWCNYLPDVSADFGWETGQTANPVQTTTIFGVKERYCRGTVDAGFPLQYSDFPHGRALSSAG